MFILLDLVNFSLVSLSLTATMVVARWLLERAASGAGQAVSGSTDKLRPAELSYLLRAGDMSNVAVVLCFDLLHRAAKARLTGIEAVELADYERNAWQRAKEYVKGWTEGQIDKVVPDFSREGLAQVTGKVSKIYRFATGTARSFVVEVIADPKKLRRYISFAGVARFAADLASAGYQQVIQQELSADLLSRGLLVPVERRKQWAVRYKIAAVIGLLSTLLVAYQTLPDQRFAVACMLFGAVNAFLAGIFLFVKDLLPVYGELKDVFAHLKRSGWRVRALRWLVRLLTVAAWSTLTLILLVVLLLECLAIKFGLGVLPGQSAVAILLLTGNSFFVIGMFGDADRLEKRPLASGVAARLIGRQRKLLSEVSPLESFKSLLSQAEYNPEFSELLALYGIETLWLLA